MASDSLLCHIVRGQCASGAAGKPPDLLRHAEIEAPVQIQASRYGFHVDRVLRLASEPRSKPSTAGTRRKGRLNGPRRNPRPFRFSGGLRSREGGCQTTRISRVFPSALSAPARQAGPLYFKDFPVGSSPSRDQRQLRPSSHLFFCKPPPVAHLAWGFIVHAPLGLPPD